MSDDKESPRGREGMSSEQDNPLYVECIYCGWLGKAVPLTPKRQAFFFECFNKGICEANGPTAPTGEEAIEAFLHPKFLPPKEEAQ